MLLQSATTFRNSLKWKWNTFRWKSTERTFCVLKWFQRDWGWIGGIWTSTSLDSNWSSLSWFHTLSWFGWTIKFGAELKQSSMTLLKMMIKVIFWINRKNVICALIILTNLNFRKRQPQWRIIQHPTRWNQFGTNSDCRGARFFDLPKREIDSRRLRSCILSQRSSRGMPISHLDRGHHWHQSPPPGHQQFDQLHHLYGCAEVFLGKRHGYYSEE